jgi:hypothetical protein
MVRRKLQVAVWGKWAEFFVDSVDREAWKTHTITIMGGVVVVDDLGEGRWFKEWGEES